MESDSDSTAVILSDGRALEGASEGFLRTEALGVRHWSLVISHWSLGISH